MIKIHPVHVNMWVLFDIYPRELFGDVECVWEVMRIQKGVLQ